MLFVGAYVRRRMQHFQKRFAAQGEAKKSRGGVEREIWACDLIINYATAVAGRGQPNRSLILLAFMLSPL